MAAKKSKRRGLKKGTKLERKHEGRAPYARPVPPGRPVDLTDEVLERIATHVADGNYLETAANLEGASIRAARLLLAQGAKALRELARGDAVDEKLDRAIAFTLRIRKATAQDQSEGVRLIKTESSWKAVAWRLERKYPRMFGRRDLHTHRHGGPTGGAIPVAGLVFTPEVLKGLTDQELEVYERLCAKLGGSSAGGDSGGESAPSG